MTGITRTELTAMTCMPDCPDYLVDEFKDLLIDRGVLAWFGDSGVFAGEELPVYEWRDMLDGLGLGRP